MFQLLVESMARSMARLTHSVNHSVENLFLKDTYLTGECSQANCPVTLARQEVEDSIRSAQQSVKAEIDWWANQKGLRSA